MKLKKTFNKIDIARFSKKTISFLKENKKLIVSILILVIAIDIFYVPESSDYVIFSILIFYGIFVKITKIKSNATFLLCLGLLFAMFFNYLFTSTSVATEKAAVWLVLFLAIGIFQQWRE